MKFLILSVIVTGIAVSSQAANNKNSTEKTTVSCCAEETPSKETKSCQMTKDGKTACASSAKNSRQTTSKRVLQSPKALAAAR